MKVERSISFRTPDAGDSVMSPWIRGRAGNRWIGTRWVRAGARDDRAVFALDGESGRVLAAGEVEWFADWEFLPKAIADDIVLLPRAEGGRTRLAPVVFTPGEPDSGAPLQAQY